jgi:hypothetical protein
MMGKLEVNQVRTSACAEHWKILTLLPGKQAHCECVQSQRYGWLGREELWDPRDLERMPLVEAETAPSSEAGAAPAGDWVPWT